MCPRRRQKARTLSFWNPLPGFATVRRNRQLGNIQLTHRFYEAARRGRLPAVSWVIPGWDVSEHPRARVSDGQAYVTSLINAVMRGPQWKETAIFLSWDDWGGFYDHLAAATARAPRAPRPRAGLRPRRHAAPRAGGLSADREYPTPRGPVRFRALPARSFTPRS